MFHTHCQCHTSVLFMVSTCCRGFENYHDMVVIWSWYGAWYGAWYGQNGLPGSGLYRIQRPDLCLNQKLKRMGLVCGRRNPSVAHRQSEFLNFWSKINMPIGMQVFRCALSPRTGEETEADLDEQWFQKPHACCFSEIGNHRVKTKSWSLFWKQTMMLMMESIWVNIILCLNSY